MCSVFGCYSWRRRYAQRFKLPDDPERRLEWVQFLATVNKQRFKESSWTDITICSQHFKDDCFELTPSHSGDIGEVRLTLKSSAVPSLLLHSVSDQPETHLERPKCGYVETTCEGPTSYSEETRLTSRDARECPVPKGLLGSTDSSDFFISVHGQKHPKSINSDLIKKKAGLLQTKGRYVVNEKRLLQLFSRKCPSCGSKLKMEKVTYGVVVMLNQQCLQCEYRNQWKSQVNAGVPTAEDQHLTGGTDVTPETQQAAPTDDTHSTVTEITEDVAVSDEESEPIDETEESSDQDDMDSDEDWKPVNDFLKARELQKGADDKPEDEDEDEDEGCGYYVLPVPRHSELCTECGKFFNKLRPHTCEHKIKPFSCNICGKRCVSEVALNCHSRIHDENYEHRCKFCHITFKTKVDKQTHEQTHIIEGKPYKCPDCSETFATNKQRRIHLEDHRGPPQLKCHICGIEFRSPPYLQRHLAVHTGEKPFKCSVCQRGFNQAGHLKSHMRLHTGERPYKCQHCDKCFNHNVSLKSHVQRYHSASSGLEQKNEKINEKEGDTVDAEADGNKTGTDSVPDNVEEEQDSEEEEQEERIYRTKTNRKSTGRPIGRPRSHESGSLVLAVQVEGQCSNSKTGKQQAQKLKRTQYSDEESEDEPSDSDASSDSAEEEEEEKDKKAIKNTARSRGRPKNCDSDSDFDPAERKKKRCSSQNSGKSSGKRRGRPRKNLVV